MKPIFSGRYRRRHVAGASLLACLAQLGSAHAISVDRSVVPGGGGASRSTRFSVTGSAGQPVAVTAPSAGTRFAERAGFWGQNSRWLNAIPFAASTNVIVRGTAATSVILGGLDADGDPVTFRIVSAPAAGILTGGGAGWLYTPGGGFTTGDTFTFVANDGLVDSTLATVTLDRTRVVGRRIFYNQSAWDGNTAGPDVRDDAAVATDKVALLTGVQAGFTNYTSYNRGINGIMVDVLGLPLGTSLSVLDFGFRTGNSNTVSGWSAAPAPLVTGGVTVRRGAGAGGSDRITLIWGADAVTKKWLQVRVKATALTGLWQDDIFYFGNAVGETGNRIGFDAIVNATDEILARSNQRSAFSPAPVTFLYDFNRDKLVNATDQILARLNTTSAFTALRLITPAAAGSAASPALAGLIPGRSALASTRVSAGAFAGPGLGEVPEGSGTETAGTPAVLAGATEWPLGVVALTDGSIVVHGRIGGDREPRLEMASDLGQWAPAPYAGESYRDGEWFWRVGPSATPQGRFFRLAEE